MTKGDKPSDGLEALRLMYPLLSIRGLRLDEGELGRESLLLRGTELLATGFDASTPQLSLILTSEKPADALAHHAVNATVVVIGSRPGSLLGLVPDWVSHAVLESVHCPVLVVPRDVADSTSLDADLDIPSLI